MIRLHTRFWRGVVAVGAATALVCGGVACSSSPESGESSATSAQEASDAAWPRTIDTDDGQLELKAQPERIVSTSVTLTGSLLAVGAPVVATTTSRPGLAEITDSHGFFNQWAGEATKHDVKQLWQVQSPNIENIVDYNPDLIVVAKSAGDSVFDQVAEIRKIAPVLVIDYSGESWQDVTAKIGEATGHEKEAGAVIKDFDDYVANAKEKITAPEGGISPLMIRGKGSAVNALTDQAPQVQLLQQLGFTITEVPDEIKGANKNSKRPDIVQLSEENYAQGLPADTWLLVAADPRARQFLDENPALAKTKENKKVYYTPGETFRFDPYSARIFVDSIVEQFGA